LKTLEEVFGPNSALVEELYSQFRADPDSVPNHWRDYFKEMEGGADSLQAAEKHREPAAQEKSVEHAKPKSQSEPVEAKEDAKEKPKPTKSDSSASKPALEGEVLNHLKGVAGKIAENMEISLEIPTATSLRVIPVKMLWEDRMLVNRHLEQ
jgi:multifunctional 2-oxoglutarate metabolism enzyme